MLTENKARSEWNNYTLCQLFANSEIKPCVCTSKHTHTHTQIRADSMFAVHEQIHHLSSQPLMLCLCSYLYVTQLQLPCLSFFIIVLPAQLPCLDSSTYSTMCCMIWLWSSYKCVFFSMLYYSSITTNVTGNRTVGLTLQGYWANVSTCSYAQWNGLTSAVLFPVLIKEVYNTWRKLDVSIHLNNSCSASAELKDHLRACITDKTTAYNWDPNENILTKSYKVNFDFLGGKERKKERKKKRKKENSPSEKLIYYNVFEIHLFHAKYTTNTFTYKNTLQLYFYYTNLVYLKSAKLE